MELFTFVRMGHSAERIYLKQLGGEETARALARFDAAKAKCFYNRDREKLLAVVESGFGDLPPFNKAVRNLLGVTLAKVRSGKGFGSKSSFSWKGSAKIAPKKKQGDASSSQTTEPEAQEQPMTEVVPFAQP